MRKHKNLNTLFSQGVDVSNFIGIELKITPYHLVVFKVMTAKSDSLLIGTRTITPKGSMKTKKNGKTSLFVEEDYEQQTSTRLWIVRVNN